MADSPTDAQADAQADAPGVDSTQDLSKEESEMLAALGDAWDFHSSREMDESEIGIEHLVAQMMGVGIGPGLDAALIDAGEGSLIQGGKNLDLVFGHMFAYWIDAANAPAERARRRDVADRLLSRIVAEAGRYDYLVNPVDVYRVALGKPVFISDSVAMAQLHFAWSELRTAARTAGLAMRAELGGEMLAVDEHDAGDTASLNVSYVMRLEHDDAPLLRLLILREGRQLVSLRAVDLGTLRGHWLVEGTEERVYGSGQLRSHLLRVITETLR